MNNQRLTSSPDTQRVWRVWLLRHGQTSWNEEGRFCGRTDIALSPRGQEQAQWLATRLHSLLKRPVVLYSSDLARARETADTLSRTFATPVISSAAWREIDFGDFEGLTYQQVEAQFPEHLGFFTEPDRYAPLHGEPLSSVVQRTQEALITILHEQASSSDIIIVSHGGALRALLCTLLHMPLRYQWQLRIDTASISAVNVSFEHDGSLLATLALLNLNSSL